MPTASFNLIVKRLIAGAALLFLMGLLLACQDSSPPATASTPSNPTPATNKQQVADGAATSYSGAHDSADCEMISGWAWDRMRPEEAIKVDIYDGNVLLVTVAADQLRQDLNEAQMGNDLHGFEYALPENLKDGKPHLIQVTIAGTDLSLRGTPKPIICQRARADIAANPLSGGLLSRRVILPSAVICVLLLFSAYYIQQQGRQWTHSISALGPVLSQYRWPLSGPHQPLFPQR